MVQESVKFMQIRNQVQILGGASVSHLHMTNTFGDITIFDIVQKCIILLKHQFCLKFECLTLLICFCTKWKQKKWKISREIYLMFHHSAMCCLECKKNVAFLWEGAEKQENQKTFPCLIIWSDFWEVSQIKNISSPPF